MTESVFPALDLMKALLVTMGLFAMIYVTTSLVVWMAFDYQKQYEHNLGPIVATAVASMVYGVFCLGQFASRMIEGLYPEQDPSLPIWPTVVSLVSGAGYFGLMLVVGKCLAVAVENAKEQQQRMQTKKEANGS